MRRQNRIQNKGSYLLGFLLTFLLLLSTGGSEVVSQAATAEKGVYLYDGADLYDSDEEEEIQEYLEKQSQKAGMGIYVLTSDDSGYGATDRYIEDFYDEGYDSGEIDKDAVLMHIDMEERYVNIQPYGAAESKIPDATGEIIIDYIFNELKAGDYEGAAKQYAERAEHYLNYVPVYATAGFQLIASLIVGAIAVAIMAASSGGKMTAGAAKYQDARQSGIRARRDDYIRTSVTKRRKPESNGGGGRSSGGSHRSSGGHSHSSAGRHF